MEEMVIKINEKYNLVVCKDMMYDTNADVERPAFLIGIRTIDGEYVQDLVEVSPTSYKNAVKMVLWEDPYDEGYTNSELIHIYEEDRLL